MRKCFSLVTFLCCSYLLIAQSFSIRLPDTLSKKALNGRLLLLISNNNATEPRFQIADGPNTQLVFGIDVENWQPGTTQTISVNAFGYPIESLAKVPTGNYYIQALLHIYETFHRKDGKVVKLPMDRGEGQHWNRAPGNIYSIPVKIKFNPLLKIIHNIILTKTIPPIKTPEDSKYIRHIKIQSKLLTEFW